MGFRFNPLTGMFDIVGSSGGGGSSNSFETMQTPNGTSPVATGPSDVLTWADGVGIEITGDSVTDNITIAIAQDTPNAVAGFDNSGDFVSFDNYVRNTQTGFDLTQSLTPSDIGAASVVLNRQGTTIAPTEDSTDNYFQQSDFFNVDGTFDVASVTVKEFALNINDTVDANNIQMSNEYFNFNSSGIFNNVTFTNKTVELGNGTDTSSNQNNFFDNIYLNIKDNHTSNNSYIHNIFVGLEDAAVCNDVLVLNATGSFYGTANTLQGFAFNPNIQVGASVNNTTWGYSNPQIDASITNFNGLTLNGFGLSAPQSFYGVTVGPNFSGTISQFQGLNIGTGSNNLITNFAGVNITGDVIGDTLTGVGISTEAVLDTSFTGLNINPTVTGDLTYAAGINVNMNNVSVYAGVAASVVIQDLTYTCDEVGTDGNGITIQYTGGGTAGSEVVTVMGFAISVQIQSGVSTATQIKTAIEAAVAAAVLVNISISGVGSNTQVTVAATNLAGGINAGQKYAAYLDGDVTITGALQFSGSLSVGALNAFASQPLVDGGGVPGSIHSLITQPTVAANATVVNADLLAVNTASLINIGDNATVTTSFLGVAALGLPAVLNMGTGSTVDTVVGAVFALSLDAGATGGTVDEAYLCRALSIPNGVTTVSRLYGYGMDLPFGDPGTVTWGFYESPGVHNYFQGDLLIGGTAGSDDVVTNTSVALEIKSTTKAFLNVRMTTTERNALTAVNGMQIYNSTTNKLQVYAAGSWVDLH